MQKSEQRGAARAQGAVPIKRGRRVANKAQPTRNSAANAARARNAAMPPRAWLVALAAAAAAQSHDVTLVTQATVEKLWLFPELCERWRGPLA